MQKISLSKKEIQNRLNTLRVKPKGLEPRKYGITTKYFIQSESKWDKRIDYETTVRMNINNGIGEIEINKENIFYNQHEPDLINEIFSNAITLDGLQTKNQFCQGLLLDEGQKHTEHKNVFQVEKVYSAFHDGKAYPTYADDDHQRQQKEAGIATTEANKHDTDVRKSDKTASNPSAAQQWKDGVDYKIVSDKEITLKLRYLYNKIFLEGNIRNKYAADIVNNLWLFNYFILNEGKSQTHFLPIRTCRYPNQIAKIKVYPDISWTFHLNYGMKNPLYYRDTWVQIRQHRVDDAVIKAQAVDIDG